MSLPGSPSASIQRALGSSRSPARLALPGFLFVFVAGSGLAFGCKSRGSEARPAPSSTASAPSASTASAPTPSLDGGAGLLAPLPPSGMGSIPERFAVEAKSRPSGVVRVEDVLAAFEGAGAELRERRQHLGAPFLAAYCVGAQAGTDVHLSVCEYADAARAKAGKAMSEQAFGAVPNRSVHQNGGTTLTVRVGGTSAADEALAGKLTRTFAGLRPKG